MYIWFFICVLAVIAVTPLHFLSVEHLKLQERYGKEKGTKIGKIYGLISGWGFFFFWIGIWVSPQPRFTVQILHNLSIWFQTRKECSKKRIEFYKIRRTHDNL